METESILEEINLIIERILERYNYLLNIYISLRSQKEQMEYIIEASKGVAAQRTKEWYKMRNACITASAINHVLGSDSKRNKFITEKCGAPGFFGNMYTDWGVQYEPIATMLYEKIYNVKIYDAPLLIHPIYSYVGASCDGFVIDHDNNDGYLIEIKCPYSRAPNGEIPEHYWEQPQTQMEVCKMDTCVFFDCKFQEYTSKEEFLTDTSDDYVERGFMVEYIKNSKKNYIYDTPLTSKQDIEQAEEEFKKNYRDKFNADKDCVFTRFIRWKLVNYSKVLQRRNTKWFEDNIPRLRYVWDIITHYRQVGIKEFNVKSKIFSSEFVLS